MVSLFGPIDSYTVEYDSPAGACSVDRKRNLGWYIDSNSPGPIGLLTCLLFLTGQKYLFYEFPQTGQNTLW